MKKRRVMMSKLIQIILPLCIIFSLQISAQNTGGYTIETEENRTIPQVYRKQRQPVLKDTVIPPPEVNYSPVVRRVMPDVETSPIEAARLKIVEKLPPLYNSYVRLGIGSNIMPLADIYVNSKRSRNATWGLHVNHLSHWGKLKDHAPARFDNNKAKLFGNWLLDEHQIGGQIDFFNNGLNYYGSYNDSTLDKDSLRQRFNNIGAKVNFGTYKGDSAKFNYNFNLGYYNFSDKIQDWDTSQNHRAMENHIDFKSHMYYEHKKEVYSLDFGVIYNNYKYGFADSTTWLGQGINDNNTIINLFPKITSYGKKWRAFVGVDLVFDIRRQNKFYAIPKGEFQYSFFNDILIPYVGITGHVKPYHYKNTSQINNFVRSGLTLENEVNNLRPYIGFKGTLGKHVTFDLNASYGKYKNLNLFVQDTTFFPEYRFTVIQDTANIVDIGASISYQLDKKLSVDLEGKYYIYSPLHQPYVWNRPDFEIHLRGRYNLFDKIYLNLDLSMEGGRKTPVYNNTTADDVLETNGVFYKKLGFLADANLGIEYRYTKRMSAFLNFNNFAAQRYQKWIDYPVVGFQVLGGVTFRF